jgi:hypothetical protein
MLRARQKVKIRRAKERAIPNKGNGVLLHQLRGHSLRRAVEKVIQRAMMTRAKARARRSLCYASIAADRAMWQRIAGGFVRLGQVRQPQLSLQ